MLHLCLFSPHPHPPLPSLKRARRWVFSKTVAQALSLHRTLQWLHLTQDKSQKPTSLWWFARTLTTRPLCHLLWLSSWIPCLGAQWQVPLRHGPLLPFFHEGANAGTSKMCHGSPHLLPGPALQLPSRRHQSTFMRFAFCRFCFHMWFFLLCFALGHLHASCEDSAASSAPGDVRGGSDLGMGLCVDSVPPAGFCYSLSVLETITLIQIHLKHMKLYKITFSL